MGNPWPHDPARADTPVAHSPDDVAVLARTSTGFTDLDARVSVCRACPRLVAWREEIAGTRRAAYADQDYWGRPAPSFGDPDAAILVVGLAPAAHGANRTGRMFTGDRSGDWLYAALHRAGYASQSDSTHAGDGLRLTGVRITAAVHCAPPANRPTPAEFAACGGWLDRELVLMAPRLRAVLALGGHAWSATLASVVRIGGDVPQPKPKFGHGATATIHVGDRTIRMVASYHVSQQNTFTGRLTTPMLDAAIAQLGQA